MIESQEKIEDHGESEQFNDDSSNLEGEKVDEEETTLEEGKKDSDVLQESLDNVSRADQDYTFQGTGHYGSTYRGEDGKLYIKENGNYVPYPYSD